ncbi:rhomboid family intramembrane serine protease [Nocardioides baekrokdamisoli]|uniref:Rhomboid family intramembrane serine protease n=1 Tax=Nocardioides baekrokdamisoli TaxID=1804624 RepID=A0A3G9II61_9ACTN|nr:rhomboid family intramembrane serine protease [Nocardioides baekrokdamisoli]BBH18036.1 rhomboid family intramembrane serine protease [Nocardioides baekrokdamisoli]
MSTTQPSPKTRPIKTAAVGIGTVTAGLYGVELLDASGSHSLDGDLGLHSHRFSDLWAVFTSPLVHASWEHLLGNTVPLVILGFIVLLEGWRRFLGVSFIGAITAGLSAWLFSPAHTVTVGASGVIFALLTYLIARGIYTRKIGQIVAGVVIAIAFGSLVWGVLPTSSGISWQAHLGGALGGVLAAWVLSDRSTD